MIVEIKAPSPGESISEVEIASWLVEDGDYVEKDQEIAEVESDKATLQLIAEQAGKISILAGTGEIIPVGKVVCSIDTSAKAPAGKKKQSSPEVAEKSQPEITKKETPSQKVSGSAVPGSASSAKISPVAAKMMKENGLSVDDIISGLKRITKKEVRMVLDGGGSPRVPDLQR